MLSQLGLGQCTRWKKQDCHYAIVARQYPICDKH